MIVPARPQRTTLSTCQESMSACSCCGMADGVHAELAHDAGLVVGEVLEAQEVVFKVALVVQVDVERAEIDVLGQEVFRGRIARVGIERGGVDGAREVDQVFEEFGHAPHAQPADHGGGDLVADEVAEHGRVAPVRADGVAHGVFDLFADRAVVEKLDVLGPGDRDQHEQPGLGEQVHEPARRDVVNAQQVDAQFAHEREVGADLVRRADEVPGGVGMKRAVGDALEEKFVFAPEKEFGLDADAVGRRKSHAEADVRTRGGSRVFILKVRVPEGNDFPLP